MKATINRRKFFKIGLSTALVSVIGSASATNAKESAQPNHNTSYNTSHNASHNANRDISNVKNSTKSNKIRARIFFQTQLDFDVLSSACERIYPKDENTPGAIDLGAPYFIDHQLASAYGYNDREYLAGPFHNGKAEQNYQTPMKRNEIFLAGIKALENEAQKNFKKSFVSISHSKQDQILSDFENNKINTIGFSSHYFFLLLRDMTIAGVFSDPIYGGNDNKNGWRMIGYPGAQMSYADKIESDEFFTFEPMSLSDMES